MTVCFVLMAAVLAYAAGLQKKIHDTGPCYRFPLACDVAGTADLERPNDVVVWLQTLLFVLFSVAEILGLVALSEWTYSQVPTNLKAFMQALEKMSTAVGNFLGVALGPVLRNPRLVIVFASLAGTIGLSVVLFWLAFRRYDSFFEEKVGGNADEDGERVND